MPKSPPSSRSDDRVSGAVERVLFFNEENGYAVIKVEAEGRRDPVTVVGNVPSITAGERIVARGSWRDDARFGRQFKAESLHVETPASLTGIERYLGSGFVDGIGPAYAEKLVKKFGDKIFDVIDHASARLEEVEGIGKKRRLRIKGAWEVQKAVREIMVFLHAHGISGSRALRIYKTYKDRAIEVLKKNPYLLARDITGIGFKTADRIAERLGIARDSSQRMRAGLDHRLLEASGQGHCALPRAQLIDGAAEMLEVGRERVETELDLKLAEAEAIQEAIDGQDLVFLPHLRRAEDMIAARILQLASRPPDYPEMDRDKALEWSRSRAGVALSDSQAAAVLAALDNRVLIITGGPGVGKTTILNSILQILRAKKVKPVLAAPTGRAARRLAESTGLEAKTIHRLLEVKPPEGFTRTASNPLEGGLFVVDESSMMDVSLMHWFLRALPPEAHLILVGDVDQLPSVGPGQVLADLIAAGTVPVVRLTEVFRQAATSRIITAAHDVNEGRIPNLETGGRELTDFYFMNRDDSDSILATLPRLVRERLPATFNLDPLKDIQVLTPMNRNSLGAVNLNRVLQDALNPPGEFKVEIERFGVTYRLGDKVIQTRNDYDKDVFNGDIGRVSGIGGDPLGMSVRFEDGREVAYLPGELDNLQLAYAITIHKSQGSEFPAVVIPVSTQHYVMLQRNLLYTGITRGKRLVVLVGEEKALAIAVRNRQTQLRYSGLRERLQAAER